VVARAERAELQAPSRQRLVCLRRTRHRLELGDAPRAVAWIFWLAAPADSGTAFAIAACN
jgi:hypothetical protein